MEISGLIIVKWTLTGYGVAAGRLWTSLPTVQIWCTVISSPVDPLKQHVAGKRFVVAANVN
jgi:hypothetical protein